MKCTWISLATAGVLLASIAAPAARAATTPCTTQGQFALTLAQVANLVRAGATQEEAAATLAGKGVRPTAGWQLEVCLSPGVEAEVEAALQAAIGRGEIDKSYADAAGDAGNILAAPSGGAGAPVGAESGGQKAGRQYNPSVSPHRPAD